MTEGHKVIAVSQFVKDHIIKNYKIDQDKIVLNENGFASVKNRRTQHQLEYPKSHHYFS